LGLSDFKNPPNKMEDVEMETLVQNPVDSPAAEEKQEERLGYGQKTSIPDEDHGYGSGFLGLYEFKLGPFVMNPVVSIIGAAVLWAFTIWCITDEKAIPEMKGWKTWVTENFTWLYIGTQNIWIIFMFFVMYFFGDRKLGKDDEKPEFGDVTYFSMLFSAGVAIGLVVYGTAEPIYHYDYWIKHAYNAGEVLDNDKANFAMLYTIYHWGFHGWVPYALVGVQLGIMSFRHGLPLLMRSAFYPILGKHTWGWIGDAIDSFTIVTVVSGVCTSLGLGVWQITTGFEGMDWLPDPCDKECKRDVYLVIIWGITVIATASVVSGIGYGIKTLSQISVLSAGFIWLVALFAGDTWFYWNSITQTVGYYFHYSLTELGWRTDAFAQLDWGSGGTPDMAGASKISDAGSSYINDWTIFYWGWWIAWCPFVGIFIARISRGRTVKEVICYSLGGPLITSILWFGLFGSMGIAMENNAQLLWRAGSDLYNDPTTFQTGMHSNPQSDFVGKYFGAINSYQNTGGFGTSNGRCGAWSFDTNATRCGDQFTLNVANCVPSGAKNEASAGCGACFVQQASFDRDGKSGCEIFKNNPNNKGKDCPKYIKNWKADTTLSPVCLFTDWDQESSWYTTLGQLGPKLGPFLNALSIVSLILFFVTSSDSGSLVVDTLAANGRDECSTIQRVFWAFTEGGLATGLVAGAQLGKEKDVLKALQAASVCTGLPYTFFLCFLMPAIWRGFDLDKRKEMGYKSFKTPVYGGIFDCFDFLLSFGKCSFPKEATIQFFIHGALPWMGVYKIAFQTDNKICNSKNIFSALVTVISAVCFYSWIVLVAISDDGVWAVGWVMFLGLATIIGNLRLQVRLAKGISGNFIEDIAAAVFMYPNALYQCIEALDEEKVEGKAN